MILFIRQLWALIRKNLLLICTRRYISTLIRALLLPLFVVLIVAYSKVFFASSTYWGISSPHPIRSLRDGLRASDGRSIVGFYDHGMKGGEVASVIDSLSQKVMEAGKNPVLFSSTMEMAEACPSIENGASDCYGGIIFLSSPNQGSDASEKGTWNYTIKADSKAMEGIVDIRKNQHGAEVYLFPLQRAVDEEIISRMNPGGENSNATTLPGDMKHIVFTEYPQSTLANNRQNNYLALCIFLFGAIFAFCMIGIVYHLTSFVATERELGMSGLIDTMIPGGSAVRARLLRQISTFVSFTIIYLPSWIAVGIVMSVVVFPNSRAIPVGYHIFSGLAYCAFSLFGASFFRKAQLSGAIMSVIILVFAFLPQTLANQSRALVTVFSLIFPSANYTYFITGLAVFELQTLKVDLMAEIPDEEPVRWRIPLYMHWIFLAIQIVVYPTLAFYVEHMLFSTASKSRTFVAPENDRAPTVTLTNFCKTYKPAILSKIFRRRKDVNAVVDMTLSAHRGQILCLLGPNGSGKSTTLNSISGESRVTSGMIQIDPTGGLGYAPQANVIWPELTVEEHIRIFSDLKCVAAVNEEVIAELVSSCDLGKKLSARAKTLSGGQKRKLQLAMMFAGGSAVCCVDEVSTGLDPISRRRIWEILLAERGRRTIIMTTHFLDEADYLADNIAIMYKGSLKAEGTAAALKHRYGNGYTIKVDGSAAINVKLSGPVETESIRHQMVYRVATATLAAELVEELHRNGIDDYQVSGPTMEELFLKATGDTIQAAEKAISKGKKNKKTKSNVMVEEASEDTHALVPMDFERNWNLTNGRPISAFKQWWILFCKRFRILRRRFIPYFVAIALAIIGAGVAPLLIKSFNQSMKCPEREFDIWDTDYALDLSQGTWRKYLVGPREKFTDEALARVADLYPRPYEDAYWGFENATSLKDQLVFVDTYDQFIDYVKHQQQIVAGNEPYLGGDPIDAGMWLGDDEEPILMNVGSNTWYMSSMMNFMNVMVSKVPIATSYNTFSYGYLPPMYAFPPLLFIIYYGLIMAAYPAFFALYPTNERLSNVRSMQYSNGIRPFPLWLSHLAFDCIVIFINSAVGTLLLYISTPVWVGLGYIFIIMVLYGIVAALLSYLISMFAKSAVTAWFMCTLGQILMYFAYFGGIIGITSTVDFTTLEQTMNSMYFGLAIISPIVSLQRAFSIGLGQYATRCNGHSFGSIYLFGGPILYLVLQIFVLFTILLWWDSSFVIPAIRKTTVVHDAETTEMQEKDLMAELQRLKSDSTDLRVESVSKSFGKNLAVDNVTFGVQTSEIFALLGPNGAGKSTIISMIRGDIKPSTSVSNITIAGNSIRTSPVAARSDLGVCPQFDSADVLTVRETLRFFAKIRGVEDIQSNVDTVIAACGLEAWSGQLAQNLSGGTKRKLSLAVALVGNPRVLVLDEPSSALDANAKRNMWRTLQMIGKGRSLVLSTHSMEEADALADRIGIVSSRMLAIGEREALKKRAGDSFHIHLVSATAPRTTPEELQAMKDWIDTTFEGAKISRETQGGQVRFEIPAEGHDLVGLTRKLEAAKDGLGIEFYSVGKATLDEVFENIVRRYGDYDRKER